MPVTFVTFGLDADAPSHRVLLTSGSCGSQLGFRRRR